MAYTDIIEFDDNLKFGDCSIEFGNYGVRWPLSTSWTNIGNKITSFPDTEYFDIDSHSVHPQVTILKRGLYHLHLRSSFTEPTNTQLGWCGIFINDPNFTNQAKFFSVIYCHQGGYQARNVIDCGGFTILNEGDIIKAAVSRSNLTGQLRSEGTDLCTIVHVFDLAD